MLDPRATPRRHVFAIPYDPDFIIGRSFWSLFPDDSEEGEEVFIFLRTPNPWRPEKVTEPGGDEHQFLVRFLWRAALRPHLRSTFVGIEALPLPILAACGFSEDELAHAGEGDDEWAGIVRTRILARTTELLESVDDHWPFLNWHVETSTPAAEFVEVLTLTEYRGRVGEEAWRVETFVDCRRDPGTE
jgi:hypothetical protein